MSNYHHDTSVLVVGAGLAGLTSAVALGLHGVPTIVIERRSEVLPHPRADGFTARTVEIFRALGLPGSLIPETDPGFKLRRARVESLVGQWFEDVAWSKSSEGQAAQGPEYSPYRGTTAPQDILEPILANRAIGLGVDIRMDHELVGLSQNEEGTIAVVKTAQGTIELRSRYLIAADGHRSVIRDIVRIPRSGYGHVDSIKSILFRAPALDSYLKRGVTQFTIDQPDFKAFLIAYQDGRLVLHLPSNIAADEESQRSFAFKAIGTSDVGMDVLGYSRWEMSALVSDNFSSGRVFLIGDAAHSLPPNRGGYGANTGIADAHNLGWKLAHVLSGLSAPGLLDTYDSERRPVAWLRHDQIFARTDYKTLQRDTGTDTGADQVAIEDSAMEFGELYRSSAMVGVCHTLPPARRPDQWAGQPGTRAPHILIQRNGQTVSSIDLFRGQWVLLARNISWRYGLDEASSHVSIDALFVEVAQPEPVALTFEDAFGVTSDGATLVRPDGYIAWRATRLSEASALVRVLKQVLFVP